MDMASTDPHIPCGSSADLDFVRKLLNPLCPSPFPTVLTFALNSLLVVQKDMKLTKRVGIGLPSYVHVKMRGLMVQCGIVGDPIGPGAWKAVGMWLLSPRICGLCTRAVNCPLTAR